MIPRLIKQSSVAILSATLACLALTGCPVPTPTPDANEIVLDAGNVDPRAACSGGCAANQKCDTAKKVCVDACGGCDAGTCVKVMDGVFDCREVVTSCNSIACDPGQTACVGGSCSCLSAANSSGDTCRSNGKWCNNSNCINPRRYEECIVGSESAKCPSGHICDDSVFDFGVCLKDCSTMGSTCDNGELCAGLDNDKNACLPQGLFRNQECAQNIPTPDGGYEVVDGGGLKVKTVAVGNTCLLKNSSGVVADRPGLGSGNCTYTVFKQWDQGVYPFRTCRPPGGATEGQTCKNDYTAGAIGTQCGTGLECALTRGGDQGVCLRMCNANPPIGSYVPQPACGANEACVNLYRYSDPNNDAVLGVCMKTCDVFDATKNTCANVGTTPTSCVPTPASGQTTVSTNGSGVCVPQQQTLAATGATCSQTDPFHGAACASGQVCNTVDLSKLASCTPVCDVTCSPADGGTGPARCATQPNAQCESGKSCRRVTQTSGATLGFCL